MLRVGPEGSGGGGGGTITDIVGGSGITVTDGTGPIATVALTTPVANTVAGVGFWFNAVAGVLSAAAITLTGNVTQGAEVGGNVPLTVTEINSASVPAAGALTTGNVLQVTGASALSYAPVNLAGGANFVTGVLPAANQAAQAMGGDVTGTTAASVVSKIDGASVPAAGALTTGNVLQVTGASALSYAPVNLAGGANFVTGALPAANQAAQAMGGDVTGTTAASVVAKIQGVAVPVPPGAGTTVLTDTTGALTWAANAALVTWANDLAGSTNTDQFVVGITGNAGAVYVGTGATSQVWTQVASTQAVPPSFKIVSSAGFSAASVSGAGGALTLASGSGTVASSGTAVGGAGGALALTTGAGAAGLGSTSQGGAGGLISLTAGNGGISAATNASGAGGGITVTTGTGGNGAAGGSTGGASGNLLLSVGVGGVGTVGATGGAGGTATVAAGAGGSQTSGPSGAGGALSMTGGAGGAVTTGTGGVGGAVTISGGQGGTASSTGTNGAGGTITLAPGLSGASTTGIPANGGSVVVTLPAGGSGQGISTNSGGNAGNFTITGSPGGVAGSGGAGTPGTGSSVAITCGNGGGNQLSSGGVPASGGTFSVTTGSGGTPGSTAVGGAGGALTLATGNGHAGGSGSGNGGAGGNLTLKTGTGGAVTSGTAGLAGAIVAQIGGTSVLSMGVAGVGLLYGSTTQSIAGSGTTTLTPAQYLLPLILLTGALTGPAIVVFPNVAGLWIVDVSGLTGLSGINTLVFQSGTATTTAITTLTTNSNLYLISTYGGNTISINL